MTSKRASKPLSILHILTLNGRNGEYGGPVKVARELCAELNSIGHSTHIFSGALEESQPIPRAGISEEFILVKPLLNKFPVSTLWSWKLIKAIDLQIRRNNIVHIHFARDLIPFLAAVISIWRKKPYLTQTHGMIISNRRWSTRFIDFFLTRPILKRSSSLLILGEFELENVRKLIVNTPIEILPNGIKVNIENLSPLNSPDRVAYLSRINKRKRVDRFIDLAEKYRESGIIFELYGPDGGDLDWTLNEIARRELSGCLTYKGSINSWSVSEVLARINLLVLPSENEPFPMVVLEALATGTPVLIMPSCGLADNLRNFEDSYVATSETFDGLVESFEKQRKADFNLRSRQDNISYCREKHSIRQVAKSLIEIYEKVIVNV